MSLYLVYMTWSALNSSPYEQCKPALYMNESNKFDVQSFVSLLICFACVIYSTMRLSSRAGVKRMAGLPEEETDPSNEEDFSNWPYFYWILALGTLYLMMTLTNWFT